MQGFNKYYPPDFDPEKHSSLNAYRGKHALGDRARKLNQGVLITRFELPYNIWCEGCNNHIGMGVRYNAEKKKIGNYYSTPIYEFRCKCHLCDNWFTIETDPKNTRYVVTSGARKKDEEWNPEENGGFAIHNPDPNAGPIDPLAALEKTTDAQKFLTTVQVPRLESLQDISDHYNSDPYSLSVKVRKQFRLVKKIEKAQKAEDDEVKGRYGLPETLELIKEDEVAKTEAKEEWNKSRREYLALETAQKRQLQAEIGSLQTLPPSSGASNGERRRRMLPASTISSTSSAAGAVTSLRSRLLQNTVRQSDPFLSQRRSTSAKPSVAKEIGVLVRK